MPRQSVEEIVLFLSSLSGPSKEVDSQANGAMRPFPLSAAFWERELFCMLCYKTGDHFTEDCKEEYTKPMFDFNALPEPSKTNQQQPSSFSSTF